MARFWGLNGDEKPSSSSMGQSLIVSLLDDDDDDGPEAVPRRRHSLVDVCDRFHGHLHCSFWKSH
ncbi:CopG family transcripitonal regulator [Anopheles sinensis]|uniref:CopG family transcripitonal regulator n=1 Tax=Anopheles sinensis TaxID=74873 RepID=A0A084WFU5_ANOSI|nr:CopG family transcripitonal regulator [Anopheles sinensis]